MFRFSSYTSFYITEISCNRHKISKFRYSRKSLGAIDDALMSSHPLYLLGEQCSLLSAVSLLLGSYTLHSSAGDRTTTEGRWWDSVSPGLCSFSAHNGFAVHINPDEDITPCISQQEKWTRHHMHRLCCLYIMVRTVPAGLLYCIRFCTAKFGHIFHYGYNH